MRHRIHASLAAHKQLSILAVFALLVVAQFASAADVRDAMDRARLEKMLADGDAGMVVQVFKRHPGRTLPFIDRYLESGLAMIEKGEDQSKAVESFRTGIRFAALADQAFGGTTFSDYANSFASWSPTEQKNFRQGQREFKLGMEEADAAMSMKHLQRSLSLAKPLGDAWGTAMAQQGIAEKSLAAGDRESALSAALAAAKLNHDLRLQSDAAASFHLAAQATDELNSGSRGRVPYLRRAWEIANDDSTVDPELRAQVLKDYIAALKEAGDTLTPKMLERSEKIRAEVEAMSAETENSHE